MAKKICVPITNRTNYSKLKHILIELRERFGPDALHIVASSTILLERYGKAFEDLIRDGFTIDKKIDCILMNDSHEAMAKTTGLSLMEHASFFGELKPDLMLVVGDRFDMLAPVVAASMMNIPMAHIQGGETSGTIDNTVRNVISKFSRHHFVATDLSRQHLLEQGILDNSIHNFGCPAVEYISKINIGDHFDKNRLAKRFKRDLNISAGTKYLLVMLHPDTTQDNDVNMDRLLDAVESFDIPAFVFYPNADAKNFQIVSDMAKHKENSNFYMLRHMPLEDFVHTMAHAACMIGNSSAGIREAALFGTPVINIGSRQTGRERNANVIDVPSGLENIKEVIARYIDYRFPVKNIYYRENCIRRTVDEICKILG